MSVMFKDNKVGANTQTSVQTEVKFTLVLCLNVNVTQCIRVRALRVINRAGKLLTD